MGEMFGSYARALKGTFTSELLSMNCLMGGMLPVSALAFQGNPDAHDPAQPLFWFRMSCALMVGAAFAYPMNWWLVAHHLKHGMLTVRPQGSAMPGMDMSKEKKDKAASGSAIHAPSPPVWVMALVSFTVLAIGVSIAVIFGTGH
jgi:hypothetical protein